jgi:hypothetical protein
VVRKTIVNARTLVQEQGGENGKVNVNSNPEAVNKDVAVQLGVIYDSPGD